MREAGSYRGGFRASISVHGVSCLVRCLMRYALFTMLMLGIAACVGCDSDDGENEPEEAECTFGAEFVEQFDRGCSEDSDCALTFHALDCCFTLMASGVNTSEQDRFEAAWAACEDEVDRCRCASGPTVVDDGSTTSEHDSISVRCEGGECRSYLP